MNNQSNIHIRHHMDEKNISEGKMCIETGHFRENCMTIK